VRILIAYSTTDGHTREICERLRLVLQRDGNDVTLLSVADESVADLRAFDRIVVGASIRYGKHSPLLIDFVHRNADILNDRPSAFFSVSVSARKPRNRQPETNAYLRKFLRQVSWRPREIGIFAGKIDYPRYSFFDRMMIRFIMLLTGGPTERDAVVDFTDWNEVEAFGRRLGARSAVHL
jgi:menaquinone-dependent protoporphyrinogen oxidase